MHSNYLLTMVATSTTSSVININASLPASSTQESMPTTTSGDIINSPVNVISLIDTTTLPSVSTLQTNNNNNRSSILQNDKNYFQSNSLHDSSNSRIITIQDNNNQNCGRDIIVQHHNNQHHQSTTPLTFNKIEQTNLLNNSEIVETPSTTINIISNPTTVLNNQLLSTTTTQNHNDLKIIHLNSSNINDLDVTQINNNNKNGNNNSQLSSTTLQTLHQNSNILLNESTTTTANSILSTINTENSNVCAQYSILSTTSNNNKPNNNSPSVFEFNSGLNVNNNNENTHVNSSGLCDNINLNVNNNNNNKNNAVNNDTQIIKSSSNLATINDIGPSTSSTTRLHCEQSSSNMIHNHNYSSVDNKITIHMSADSLSSTSSIDFDNHKLIDEPEGYQDNTSSNSQHSAGGGSVTGGGSTNGGTGGNVSGGNNCSGSISGNNFGNGGGGGVGGVGGLGLTGLGGGNNVINGNGNSSSYASLLPPPVCTTGGNTQPGSGGDQLDFKYLFEELCPVCGDKVSGYHYGLLTCESCKGFFKRTVQNKKVYTCVAERSCHIDKTQRKRCPFCRFQKCLEVGMKLEAVRADRMRGGRNKFGPMYKRDRARKLQMMRQRQLALQAIRTSIGTTEIKPGQLSPSGYQQSYPSMNIKQEIQIPQVSSLTQSPDSSPSPIAIALGQVPSSILIATSLGGSGSSLGSTNTTTVSGTSSGGSSSCGQDTGSGSIQHTDTKTCFDTGTNPSSTADSVSNVEPLRVSPMIREFVQSIDDREWQTQLFALLQKQSYNQVEVDLFELMCKVLDQNLFSQVDWARNTIFFKDLKVDDQMKLLQHSWSDMLVLDHLHQRIHNGLPDETQLNNGQVFNLLGLGLLGVPQLADYFNELQNKLTELKFDMGDYVCMKFLILLNPNVRGIVNKKTVLEGHENVQAALLDYTLTCYPSVTDKFSRLLSILPEIHAMATRGEEHLYGKHCAGSAPTQTLLMEMLHAKRKV